MNERYNNIEKEKVFSAKQVNNGNCTIGLPRTPGKWKNTTPDVIDVTDIHMSCGGGMGGSSWHVYAKRIDLKVLQDDAQFINIQTYDGEEKIINKQYIVDVTNKYSILHGQADLQNDNFSTGIHDCYYRVESDIIDKVKFVDQY